MRTDLAILCGTAALLGACGNHWQLDIDAVRGTRGADGRVLVEVDTTCHIVGTAKECANMAAAGLCATASIRRRGPAPSASSASSASPAGSTPSLASLRDCHATSLADGASLRFSFASAAPLPADVEVDVVVETTQGGQLSDYQRTIVVP